MSTFVKKQEVNKPSKAFKKVAKPTLYRNSHSINAVITSNDKYNAKNTLNMYGITANNKISQTLQGSIYRGILQKNINEKPIDIVIKRTDIKMYKDKVGFVGEQMIRINEDIIQESKIMQYIQSLNPPNGFLQMYGIITDSKNIFLIMEYGGKSLFNHCKKYHSLINEGKVNLNEWKNHVKIIFKQLVSIIYFLHNKARICHMDISLENILIKGCEYKDGKFKSHGQVYLCDYGLSEYFSDQNTKFLCAKYVGKTAYQAPEVFIRNGIFDARKADIWSLGICLFMLQFGLAPLNEASMKDDYFRNIISGFISQMIKDNGKSEYLSKWFLNIINNLLSLPHNRSNINTIYAKVLKLDTQL